MKSFIINLLTSFLFVIGVSHCLIAIAPFENTPPFIVSAILKYITPISTKSRIEKIDDVINIKGIFFLRLWWWDEIQTKQDFSISWRLRWKVRCGFDFKSDIYIKALMRSNKNGIAYKYCYKNSENWTCVLPLITLAISLLASF
jgi:hypothetical protein